MVFWSNLKSKLTNLVSRREFDALKTKVDTNTTNIGNKANTRDVVLKEMTGNTTINNSGNTIVSAPIVNLTSKSGDLELRVNNTTKSITCGGARIVNVANPTVNNGVATKNYVDTAIRNIPAPTPPDLSNYYTKTESNNNFYTKTASDAKYVNLTGAQLITGVKTLGTSLKAGYGGGDFRLSPEDNTTKNLKLTNPTIGENCKFNLDLELKSKIINVPNPTGSNDVANKTYVDSGLNNKANSRDVYLKSQVYTKSESDSRYTNSNNYYTKSETDNRFFRRLRETNSVRVSYLNELSNVWNMYYIDLPSNIPMRNVDYVVINGRNYKPVASAADTIYIIARGIDISTSTYRVEFNWWV